MGLSMLETTMSILIDRDQWSEDGGPVCIHCKHWNMVERRICLAFPNGIPTAILLGENDHSKSFPGDGGFRFVPLEEPVTAGVK